ncbi:MAG: hypothetical protein GX137_05085, partial [Thermoplasmatales archaeon]|nr:hypothetical protein [Thermoplasmatales archaeon]
MTVSCGLCDTHPLGHSSSIVYNVVSPCRTIPVPAAPHPGSVFLGWSGTGITGVSGDVLTINLG